MTARSATDKPSEEERLSLRLHKSSSHVSSSEGCTDKGKSLLSLQPSEVVAFAILGLVNTANISLVVFKFWVAMQSGSFSISNSTLETFGDIFVGALILFTKIQAKWFSKSKYPRGRAMESMSTVIAAVVMIVLALLNGSVNVDKYFFDRFNPHLTNTHQLVILANIVVKVLLLAACFLQRNEPQIRVLLKDQLNDVCTNSTTLIFAHLTQYNKHFDIVGALIIFGVIMYCWLPQLINHCSKVHGIEAKEKLKEQIRQVIDASGFVTDPDIMAYHRGESVIVEVDCIVRKDLQLTANACRHQLEESLRKLPFVSVALVRDLAESQSSVHSAPEVSDASGRICDTCDTGAIV